MSGNGIRLKFWQNLWCGDDVLQEAFSELFCIAWDKDALVANYLQICNDSIHWRLDFLRTALEWELEIISSFLDLIYSTKVKGHGEDTIYWQPSPQKSFKTSS